MDGKSVVIAPCADGSKAELESLVGATVASIKNGEYSLEITFDNGRVLIVTGARWEGCCLGVDVNLQGDRRK